eukprot:7263369-Prymnesium_polylepis.1
MSAWRKLSQPGYELSGRSISFGDASPRESRRTSELQLQSSPRAPEVTPLYPTGSIMASGLPFATTAVPLSHSLAP